MRKYYLSVSLVATLFFTFGGCNEGVDNGIFEDEPASSVEQALGLPSSGTEYPEVVIQIPNILKFESRKHLQDVLDRMKTEMNISDLTSERLLNNINFRADKVLDTELAFVSLFDEKYKSDLAHLTESDWQIINSDPENLVYEPEDEIIADTYLTSLVNAHREIQIGDRIYTFTFNGVYFISEATYKWLADRKNGSFRWLADAKINDAFISVTHVPLYAPQAQADASPSSNPTLTGALKLSNGVTIPASDVRDLNYKDEGDGNAVTEFWTGLFGGHIVAIQKFSKNRHMVVNFYEQDYLIYKNIGTETKMQKKVCGIWWNCKAQEIRIGWTAIELTETYNVFPFDLIQRPDFTPNLYPNLSIDEQRMPSWFGKNFPFADNYTLFTIPFANYDVTTIDINKVYQSALNTADKAIKAWMKAENKSNPPEGLGFVGLQPDRTVRFVIGPNEDGNAGKKSLENKFLSEWFGGTYMIGYATDPSSPSFKSAKFSVTIKGNPCKLGRGSIYGAVKYDGKWLAARILKSE
ncbi:MAG: hypothetical protein LBE71_02920 [Dysgonamonadaceae bacterium]|nr:hypothetical protein [Dysgonamonadaceae bacterium]